MQLFVYVSRCAGNIEKSIEKIVTLGREKILDGKSKAEKVIKKKGGYL